MNPFSSEDILEQLPQCIIAVDHQQIVRAVNSAAERMLGKPRRLMLERPIAGILPGHPVALELIERALTLAMPCRIRNARLSVERSVQGHEIEVSMTASPYLNQHGEIVGILLHLEESGATERLEEGDRLKDTLISLGGLVLTVAHEVKNPLAGIRGAAQLLELDPIGPHVAQCTTLIRTEVDRVTRLLDSLLHLSDSQPIQETLINIHEVLDHVVRVCALGKTSVIRDYDPSLPMLRADQDRMIQVFLNLVKNAVEAIPQEGGEIRIQTRVSKQVRMSQGQRHRQVAVEVSDNGPGILEDLRIRIFMPFFTTKPSGTGLGLAISQKIVHDHGGLLELESQPGRTLFRVLLPLYPPYVEPPERMPP